jgi:hypothetical protein
VLECDYDTGLLTPDEDAHDGDGPIDLSLLLVHEAAHAITFYALGFGLTGIRLVRCDLPNDDDGRPFVFSGLDGNWTIVNRVSRRVYEGVLDEETIAWGVVSAAGPAAERKLRLAMGVPPGMKAYVGGTIGHRRGGRSVDRQPRLSRRGVAASASRDGRPDCMERRQCARGQAAGLLTDCRASGAHGGRDIGVMRGPRAPKIIEQAGVSPRSTAGALMPWPAFVPFREKAPWTTFTSQPLGSFQRRPCFAGGPRQTGPGPVPDRDGSLSN